MLTITSGEWITIQALTSGKLVNRKTLETVKRLTQRLNEIMVYARGKHWPYHRQSSFRGKQGICSAEDKPHARILNEQGFDPDVIEGLL